MKLILLPLILFGLCCNPLTAKEIEGKNLPSYSINKVSTDQTLKKTETAYIFTCLDPSGKKIIQNIKYSFNGQEKTETPDAEGKIKLKVKSGKYKFQFFLDPGHEEIYTDSIKGKGKTKTEITLSFKDATMYMIEDKPVIYLYPTAETDVSVKLDLVGEMLFTYPKYNNGWDVKAYPDGTLLQNGQTYSYLFWEGKSEIKNKDVDLASGFMVKSSDLLNFLEEKLDSMNLSSKEKQDFITYWYPRMNVNSVNYIHFMFNEAYNKYAKLNVEPKPDNLFRVFMVWSKISNANGVYIKPQTIQKLNRTGFSVVEWGGAEVDYFLEETN